MNKYIIIFFLSNYIFAQTLPKKDKGLAISYNYSNRNTKNYFKQTPIFYPTIEYKCNYNFKNNFSIKTGASIFVVGHKYKYNTYFSYTSSEIIESEGFVNTGYIRVPILFSLNRKHLYFDLGVAPCLRIFNHYSAVGKGNDPSEYANFTWITYTLESHVGYYIPLKSRRLFVEFAGYISEIGKLIPMHGNNTRYDEVNKYSQNFQLSLGFMFNRVKTN